MSFLRDYQAEALLAMSAFFSRGGMSGGISLPTGTGKTRIMTAQAYEEAHDWTDDRRIAVVVDRDVLVEQTEATLRKFITNASIGVVKAHRNELGARVLVISIHTMRSAKRLAQIPPIKLAIVDEAHMSVSPTYKRFFEHIGANTPGGARLAGYSATWTRSDGTGLGDIWQEIVYSKTIGWAISQGFLVPPRAIQIGEGVDLDEVRTKGRNGDYNEHDLGKAVMLEELRDSMVNAVLKYGGDRPGVLFAPTVQSAEFFGDALRAAGIPTEGIYGELAGGERKARHKRHDSGSTRILTTCTALAVGWDFPPASLGILLRPVRHEGLFVQMAGRLLRTSPETGKTDALLLDLVRATDDVKLRNAVDLSKSVVRDTGTDELEEVEEEPIKTPRLIHRRKRSVEVDIVAGSSAPWLVGPSGVPFLAVNEKEIIFVVEDVTGWHVGHYKGRTDPLGLPVGEFLASNLDEYSAREFAALTAEQMGARKKGRWARDIPSEKAVAYARSQGIVGAEEMNRGELADAFAIQKSRAALGYFARWSAARLELRSTSSEAHARMNVLV